MRQYSQGLTKQQHKRARYIKIQGDIIMAKLHTPLGNSNKLSPKFKGPYEIIAPDSGNKFKIRNIETGDISVRHANELKQTKMNEFEDNTLLETQTDKAEADTDHVETGLDSAQTGTSHTASDTESHDYRKKLRSRKKQVLPLTCTNEISLETDYKNVDGMLNELNIACYSFYR